MKLMLLVVTIVSLLLLGLAACSKEEGSKEQASGAADTVGQDTAPVGHNYDSLASVRYPVRDENNRCVTLETDFGNLTLELYRDVAPAHADSFVARATEGFYDSTIFHRVIDRFMIQGGDPTGTGAGQPPYLLSAEFSDLPHIEGTLSMARSMDPNSASTQFFICLERNRMTANLDGQYTVFGHLLKGYDVLHKIGSVECLPRPTDRMPSKPKEDVHIIKAYLSDSEGNPER